MDEAERVHIRDENQSALIQTADVGAEKDEGVNIGAVELIVVPLKVKPLSWAETRVRAAASRSVLSCCNRA